MSEDTQLLVIGGATLVGMFFVGKAAIDGIAQSREELREKKLLPPAPPDKKSAVDDTIKFIGSVFSMYVMVRDAPTIVEEVRSLLGSK